MTAGGIVCDPTETTWWGRYLFCTGTCTNLLVTADPRVKFCGYRASPLREKAPATSEEA